MVKYSLVHIVGIHHLIKTPPQLSKTVMMSALDMNRILSERFQINSVILSSITQVQAALKTKNHEVILYPMPSVSITQEGPVFPRYNFGAPVRTHGTYRNVYFYIPTIGYERWIQTRGERSQKKSLVKSDEQMRSQDILYAIQQKERCDEILEKLGISAMPEYPIAGTEIQKENLLIKHLLS